MIWRMSGVPKTCVVTKNSILEREKKCRWISAAKRFVPLRMKEEEMESVCKKDAAVICVAPR